MERWLKAPDPVIPPVTITDEDITARLEARWDAVKTREEILKETEDYFGHGTDPAKAGQVERARVHELLTEVYRRRFPEDFVTASAVGELPKEEPLEDPEGALEGGK